MRHRRILILTLWSTLLALACNLTGTQAPPTLSPRPTATPPPTIGYATLRPDELPQGAATMVASAASSLINLANEIETDRLMLHVDSLQNYGSRHVNSGYDQSNRGIGAAALYIRNEFEKIRAQYPSLAVFEQGFDVEWGGVSSQPYNIVAFINGTEPGAGTIVIGAHYDSVTTDPEDGDSFAPGANDNGSGVAALLEMARVLSARPHRSSIMFVAFSAEEINRRGSQAFVQAYLKPRNIDINMMINLDIIGSPMDSNGAMDPSNVRVFSAGPNESASRQAARMMELLALNHVPYMALALQDAEDRENRYGDHMSFSEAGYPSVRLTESLEDRSRQHNDRDTIDGVQGAYFTQVTRMILTIVTSLTDGLRPPSNIALRDAGNGTRTLVWEPIVGATGYVVALRRPGALRYEQFEINEGDTTSVTWDGFVPERFVGLAIAAKDSEGLMGPLSSEFTIR